MLGWFDKLSSKLPESQQRPTTPPPWGENQEEQKKPDYFEIGRSGTTEEFYAAYNATKEYGMRQRLDVIKAQRRLHEGAKAGFLEGHVENLQEIIAHPESFRMVHSTLLEVSVGRIQRERILLDVTRGFDSADKSALIILAMEKVHEDDKQNFLNEMLLDSMEICTGETDFKDFIAALMDAGADIHFSQSGHKGMVLRKAIEYSQPLPVVELLHARGASFDEALFLVKSGNNDQKLIQKIKDYREKITGEKATIEVTQEAMQNMLETMQQLREQVKDLTEKVECQENKKPKQVSTRGKVPGAGQ